MARLFSCGFENNGGPEACAFGAVTGGGGGFVTSPVRSGTYAFRRTGSAPTNARCTYRGTPTNERTFHRFYLRIAAAPSSNETLYTFRSAGNSRGGVMVKTDRTLSIADTAGSPVGSASAALALDTWYRVEVDVTSSATTSVEAKLDGTVFTTGTSYSITAGVDGADFSAVVTGDYYLDDWAINDTSGASQNSYPGSGKIIHLRPNGAGDADTGSPTRGGADSGTIQGQIDEVSPNNSTDYVVLPANPSDIWVDVEPGSTGGIGASDAITLVEVNGEISAASGSTSNWFPQIKKTSGGTIASASAITRASAAWNVNDDTDPKVCALVRYTDPDGAAWTPTTVDSMQISAKTTDGNPDTWVSALWALVEFVPPSGTEYTQSVSGTVTTAGALLKSTGKVTAGSVTTAGAIVKHTARALVGSVTSAGVLIKRTDRALSGTLTLTGNLTAGKLSALALTSTLTTAGALLKQTSRALTGTVTTVGTLAKQTSRALAGTLTTAGALTKQTARAVTGTLTTAGATVKQGGKVLAGTLTSSGTLAAAHSNVLALTATLTSAGALTKQTARALTGTLTSSGAVLVVKTALRSVAGTLTSAGALTKQTAKVAVGTLTTAGALEKQSSKLLTATLSSSGSLATVKAALRSVAGTLTSSGALSSQTSRALTGTLTSAGALLKQTRKSFVGTVTTASTLSRSMAKSLTGTLTTAGALATEYIAGGVLYMQSLVATLTTAGTLTKQTQVSRVGTLTSSGAIARSISRALVSSLAPVGTLRKLTTRALEGVLSFVGTVIGLIVDLGPTATPDVTIIMRADVSSVTMQGDVGEVIMRPDAEALFP